ncbi:MAG: hypothetical protein U0228_05175 [Myxococcaceae bacterium]
MKRQSVLAAVAFAVLAVSCSKPKEGEACEGEKGTCLDKENAIVCIGGTYAKVKCQKSATGCMEVVGNVSCDVIRDVGVPCAGSGGDCSSDGKKMLACEGGKWAFKMNCSKLCVSNVNGVRCENASGAAGDPCTKEQFDQAVCSEDKKTLLVCDGEKFNAASSCKGQNHCRAVNKNIECDTTIADVGDPCEEDGTLSCDPAKKELLKCSGKKFALEKKCPKRCMNAFNDIKCE